MATFIQPPDSVSAPYQTPAGCGDARRIIAAVEGIPQKEKPRRQISRWRRFAEYFRAYTAMQEPEIE